MLLAIGFVFVLVVGLGLGYRVGAGQWLPRVSVDLSGGD